MNLIGLLCFKPHKICASDIHQYEGLRYFNTNSGGSNLFSKKCSLIKVYTDGAVNDQLGICGLGAAFFDRHEKLVDVVYETCFHSTNNETEYQAVIMALKHAIQKGFLHLRIYSDSQILVQQVDGLAMVKSPGLKRLHHELVLLLPKLRQVDFIHVPRCKNKIADALANHAIDIWKGERERATGHV
jgi:ribonuclease HI